MSLGDFLIKNQDLVVLAALMVLGRLDWYVRL